MTALASRYAQALYDLSPDEGALDRAAEVLTGDPALWDALTSPAVKAGEKRAVLRRLPALRQTPVLLHFFLLLSDKGRMALLPEIAGAFHAIALQARNCAVCVMTCVHAPGRDQQNALAGMLCKLHGKAEVQMEIRLDPALLGGFILQIEGVTYDKSVRGQLDALSRQMQGRR